MIYTAIAALILRLLAYLLVAAGFSMGGGIQDLSTDPNMVLLVTAIIAVGSAEFVLYVRNNLGPEFADFVKKVLEFGEPPSTPPST